MLSILINAYACGPNRGSEPGMAWNWCCNLAKHCNLHIITEGEFREDIEAALPLLEYGANMHFYYLPVGEKVRRMCWNQGDWRFYYYYAKWQKRALKKANEIASNTHIDVLHQLNMIGFREPGYLWTNETLPFVWGPIDAKERFPIEYAKEASIRTKIAIYLKNSITRFQLKHSIRVNKAFKRANAIISASHTSACSIKKYKHIDSIELNETGCYLSTTNKISADKGLSFDLLWVGKLDFRKQLSLAIKAIGKLKYSNIHLHIIGGTIEEEIPFKELAKQHGIEHQCIWHEKIPHSQVQEIMRQCDLLFFTSVAEGTPHVVLEALANGLPVLCFDTCGQGDCVDETVGIKIPLTNPAQSAKDFAEKIEYLYHHREELQRMSEGCKAKQIELSWEKKAEQMIAIYSNAIRNYSNKKIR